ncbi:MAG: CvpA family protein [Planctomycetota bacterium]|nr:CvpA family protein [Planctomycetota bacterium]
MVAASGQGPAPEAGLQEVMGATGALGWVDVTALSVLGAFFILGVFKGFLWQVSRVGILVLAYIGAVELAQPVAGVLLSVTQSEGAITTPEEADTSFYIACVLVFLTILISLTLVATLLRKLLKRAGLSFYDRLGGGLLGACTGAFVVLLGMMLLQMFLPEARVTVAAERSQSMRFTRNAIEMLGNVVPAEVKQLFVPPAQAAPADEPTGEPTGEPAGDQAGANR